MYENPRADSSMLDCSRHSPRGARSAGPLRGAGEARAPHRAALGGGLRPTRHFNSIPLTEGSSRSSPSRSPSPPSEDVPARSWRRPRATRVIEELSARREKRRGRNSDERTRIIAARLDSLPTEEASVWSTPVVGRIRRGALAEIATNVDLPALIDHRSRDLIGAR